MIRMVELNQRSGFLDGASSQLNDISKAVDEDGVSIIRDPFRDTQATNFTINN